MTSQVFSLKTVAKCLGVKTYQIVYALTAQHVPEPQNVGHRRLFYLEDIERLAEHFDVSIDHQLLKENQL